MKIAHIVPSVLDEASGPSYSVPKLAAAQGNLGHRVELHTLGAPADSSNWVRVHEGSRSFPSLGSSRALKGHTQQLLDEFDVVHVHGLWMMPNVYPFAPKTSEALRVLSPRGTLLPEARSHHSWRKSGFWMAYQRRSLRADAVHATSEVEAQHVADTGYPGYIFTVPNGIDIPDIAELQHSERNTLLYLGRLHPIKGLDMLMRAWSNIEASRPEWDLIVAGPSSLGTAENLRSLVTELGLQRVDIRGPIYGDEKLRVMASADLFVLPSQSENFGMTVLEALANATPVVTTRRTPWHGLVDHECGWWIENSVQALETSLLQATGLPQQRLDEMGAKGRQWASDSFAWPGVAGSVIDGYSTALRARTGSSSDG